MSETLAESHRRNYGECLERERQHLKRIAELEAMNAPEANSQGEDESTLRLKIKELARALQKVKECLTVRGADREIWDIVDAALKKEML